MNLSHVLDLDTARALTANARGRWPTQKAAKQVRADVAMLARNCVPLQPPVTVDVTLWQRTNRRRDPDNVAGISKPMVDALVDVGVIPDDGHKHVASVTYRVGVDPDVRKGTVRVEVDVREVDE